MKPIYDKGFTHMSTNNLYWSMAYQCITKSARNLMWCMYAELKYTGLRKKKTLPTQIMVTFLLQKQSS